jgi:septal ring factor EnvC (AmiA/AmiB activator)
MRTKQFDRCIKNEMEEDMRKDLKEIREEFMELRQDVTECKTDIADNKQNIADNKQNIVDNKQTIANHRQEIHNINTRHISPNIRSKLCCLLSLINTTSRGRCGRDRMVVGFTTIYAISVNHH